MFGFEDRTRALLDAVWRAGSVAQAAQALGMDPANARRHLRTAERRVGVRLVETRRGGSGGRNARLTAEGRRYLGLSALRGIAAFYLEREGVTPVRVGARTLFAAGRHAPGPVELRIRAQSVALRRGARAGGSPRNEIPMRVLRISPEDEGTFRVALEAGSLRLDALIVRGAMQELRLRGGSRVVAVVKAVAIEVTAVGAGWSRPRPS